MPAISDALLKNVDLTGYGRVSATPSRPIASPPTSVMEPGRNSMIRCPLPPLWQASPDSLRQFYVKGQVPQFRLMTPIAVNPIGTISNLTQTVNVTTSGSSSGGSTGPSGSTTGGTIAASQAVVRTPTLSPGAKYIGTLLMPKSFQLLTVAVGSPARIQLYGTAAAQIADISRGLDIPPGAGTAQNVICDLALDTAPYKWSFQNRIGANADSPQVTAIYVTVTNLDATSDVITLTVNYVPLES